MSDPDWKQIAEAAADDVLDLRQQLDQALADVARLREAAYPLYSWCAEKLTYPQFMDANEYGLALGEALNATERVSDSFIKRKQAEAIEEAVRKLMPGYYGAPDDPSLEYTAACEMCTEFKDYAQRLRGEVEHG